MATHCYGVGSGSGLNRLSLQMNINNVFDKTYLSGILGGYGRYGDPRNVQVSMKYRF